MRGHAGAGRVASTPAVAPSGARRDAMAVRVGSGAVLIVALGSALALGGPVLDAVVGLVCLVAIREYAALMGKAGAEPAPVVLYPLALFLTFRTVLPHDVPALEWAMGSAVVVGMFLTLVHPDRAAVRWASAVGGALYIGLSLGSWLALVAWHGLDQERFGLRIVATALVASVVSDTAALFAGRALGRHPFFPHVSPHKTVEGAVAGALASLGVAAVMSHLLLGLTAAQGVGLGAVIAVVAQGGDLVESALKRTAGEKDSGVLIPGHGGLLDRLDSVVLVGPAVYSFLRLIALP